MSFDELNSEQRTELKQSILTERNMRDGEGTSLMELASADELVTDEDARSYAEGIKFSEDDFSCSATPVVKARFEVRQIDAWAEPCGGWTWNESCRLFDFKTEAKDEKRAFLRALHSHGISLCRGRCRVDYDGSIYEVCERKGGRPLLAAIPKEA